MGTESLLNEYLKKTRASAERAERSEVVQRVEAVFGELDLPWQRDDDGWEIRADIGTVYAGLDEDEEVLSFWQVINDLNKPPKKLADFYFELLKLNADSSGAYFAIRAPEDGRPPYLLILTRVAARSLDSEEVALSLSSFFWLSSVFDG